MLNSLKWSERDRSLVGLFSSVTVKHICAKSTQIMYHVPMKDFNLKNKHMRVFKDMYIATSQVVLFSDNHYHTHTHTYTLTLPYTHISVWGVGVGGARVL